MLTRIRHDDTLWNNPPFAKEEVLFDLMYRLQTAEDGLFLTDGESMFLAQSSPDMPAWIWTEESVGNEGIAELQAACEEHGIADAFVKPAVGARFFPGKQPHHRMLGNYCPRLIRPEGISGMCEHPGPGDVEAVMAMLGEFDMQVQGRRETEDQYRATAEAMCGSTNCMVWREPGGEAASLARLAFRSPRHGRIGPVVTAERFRGKGYAGAVLAALCEVILSESLTPMLYTDAEYPSSNRAYQKVGFIPVGELWRVKKG